MSSTGAPSRSPSIACDTKTSVRLSGPWGIQRPLMSSLRLISVDYKLPILMSLLAFLLPVAELPSLSSLACITEQDSAREAYTSRKRPAFGSWDEWEPKLRTEVITRVRKGWCESFLGPTAIWILIIARRQGRQGYDMLLRAKLGKDTGVNDICS